jgi:short-subunit dehydrogenase
MKNVLITGATKGMGRAIAIAFAKEGMNLAICARDEKNLAVFRQELLSLNPQIKIFAKATDGSVKEQLLEFAGGAEKELGFINIVVSSLGMFDPVSILDESDTAFSRQLDTNLMPAYHLYRFFGNKMKAKREGHLFTICSVASLNPIASAGTYSVTKYALLGLTKVMRQEMMPHQVKVTAVIPGSTLTNSWEGTTISKEKFILPEDIASAVICACQMSAGANVEEIIIRPTEGQV